MRVVGSRSVIDSIITIVRKAISRSNLSVDTVAKQADVPRDALRALLEQRTPISTAQLTRVARVVGLEPIALLQGREEAALTAEIFFRQTSWQDFDHEDTEALERALTGARALRELRALLGTAPSARASNRLRPSAVAGRSATEAAKDGEKFARQVRSLLQNPDRPLGDLRAIIEEQLEVPVFVFTMKTTDARALSVRAADLETAAIVLTASDRSRPTAVHATRVDLAHELSHLFFDPTARGHGIHLVIDRQDSHEHSGRNEQRARAFAAELLIPRAGLRTLYGEPRRLDSEARGAALVERAVTAFGATWKVTVNHLHDVGYLSDDLRETLESRPKRIPPRPEFAVRLPPTDGQSLAVTDLTRRAHEQGLINDGDARSLLGLSIGEPIPWESV